MPPYETLPCVEIPGVGQVHDHILEDAVTQAEYLFHTAGAAAAMHMAPELERLAKSRTWRAEAAADLLLRIQREFALSMSKDGARDYVHRPSPPGTNERDYATETRNCT